MQEETIAMDDTERSRDHKKDLLSSIVIFAVGVFAIVHGAQMPIERVTGSPDLWYAAPGVFPILIGSVVALLAIVLLVRSVLNAGFLVREDKQTIKRYFKTKGFIKLVVSIGFMAIYIFILIGMIPYYVASFIYLAGNMLVFRSKGYAWWKISIISIIVVSAITYGFGSLARIPLP